MTPPCNFAAVAILRVGLLQLPDIFPSSGVFRATFPPRGKAFRWGRVTPPATVCYNEYNRLACRHGYYAARCNHPVNETQRVNATGEQCSPLQAKGKFVPTSLHRTIKKYARAAGIPNQNSKFCTLNSAPTLPFPHQHKTKRSIPGHGMDLLLYGPRGIRTPTQAVMRIPDLLKFYFSCAIVPDTVSYRSLIFRQCDESFGLI